MVLTTSDYRTTRDPTPSRRRRCRPAFRWPSLQDRHPLARQREHPANPGCSGNQAIEAPLLGGLGASCRSGGPLGRPTSSSPRAIDRDQHLTDLQDCRIGIGSQAAPAPLRTDEMTTRRTNMARPRPLPFAAVLAWLAAAGPPLSAEAGLPDHLALALPVTGITVDGDLSDWPRDMPALPIRNEFGAYGATDTEGTDLGTSEDLSPSFRVGYDPGEQLLHVAVEVRDDVLHPTGAMHRTDACEIYVSALQEEERPTVQYALVPGYATYPSFDRRGVHRNPPERQEIARGLAAPGRPHHLRVEPAGPVLGADLSADRSLGDAPPSFPADPPGRRHGDRFRRGRRRRRWATGGFPRPEAFALPAPGLGRLPGSPGGPRWRSR